MLRRQSRDTDRNIKRLVYCQYGPYEGSTLETLDYTIRIGSTPTFLYFDFNHCRSRYGLENELHCDVGTVLAVHTFFAY